MVVDQQISGYRTILVCKVLQYSPFFAKVMSPYKTHVVLDRFFVQHRASRTTIQRKTIAHNQTDLLFLSWNSASIASSSNSSVC